MPAPPRRRPQPGVLAGSVLLGGLAFPLVMYAVLLLLDGVGVPVAAVGVVLFLLVFGLAFVATSMLARDARRFVEAAEARRAAARARARRLATASMPFDVDDESFARLVAEEIDALPPWVRERLGGANLHVEIDEQDDDRPYVLGTFRSWPVAGAPEPMLAITLYRLPLLRQARVPDRLRHHVRATLLHEVGHFFGMTEEDLDRFEIGNRPRPDAAPVRPLHDAP